MRKVRRGCVVKGKRNENGVIGIEKHCSKCVIMQRGHEGPTRRLIIQTPPTIYTYRQEDCCDMQYLTASAPESATANTIIVADGEELGLKWGYINNANHACPYMKNIRCCLSLGM